MENRKTINQKLMEEFELMHEIIKTEGRGDLGREVLCELVNTQIRLAAQIIREERALNGEGAYVFAPYTP